MSEDATTSKSLAVEPVSLLCSFWYYRSDAHLERMRVAMQQYTDRGGSVRMLVDSGAFSAHTQGTSIDADNYAAWLNDSCVPAWGDWMVGAFNLDVLGDAEASLANWQRLNDLGQSTIPVVHLGDDANLFDPYIEQGADYVGFGGMVGKSATRKRNWAQRTMRYLRDEHPHVRAHGLGVNAVSMMELPWYSVDSTAFNSSFLFGRLRLFDPRNGQMVKVVMSGGSGFDIDVSRMLRQYYGVNPEEVWSSGTHNRKLLAELSGTATSLMQQYYRRRHQVKPPPSRSNDFSGTVMHQVHWPKEVEAILKSDEYKETK
tara:strand:+ start:558 stop:1502 length:945 start_codon:yes stop_codon:yes gene_type:complete